MSFGLLCPSDLLPAKGEKESNQNSGETGEQVKTRALPIEGVRGAVSGLVLLLSPNLQIQNLFFYFSPPSLSLRADSVQQGTY